MAQTVIPFGDPKAQKKWSAKLAVDSSRKSYFGKKFIGADENNIIQQKTELDSDAGDRVSYDLSVQLRGEPTTGDNRLKGKEESLKFYTDEVVIDQTRKSVSAGGRMTRKRSIHNLRNIAKDRLADYWSQYIDELHFIYLSGARGINQDFIQADTAWTGHAGNPIESPDAQHLLFGGDATSKATIATDDGMSRALIERATVAARMMRAQDPNTANMMPVDVNGEKHYITLMSPFQEHAMRTETGAQGWAEIQKAAMTAEGRANPIFKGGLGMINNVILHTHESVIRFGDYGASNNLPAARALFMGRQAGVCAFGTGGGMRFSWHEEVDDFENEPVVAAGTIIGVKKTRFAGKDFGVLSLDTYARDPNA